MKYFKLRERSRKIIKLINLDLDLEIYISNKEFKLREKINWKIIILNKFLFRRISKILVPFNFPGYYLYIEASGRLQNDSARIISPIYNASYTDSGCFSFW